MKGIKQIKQYRLIKEIGNGKNGIVYEAIEDKTNKFFAIKSISNDKLTNSRIMEEFKRELKCVYKLSNKNIIKIIGVEKTINNVYLILDYCNGGNLFEYCNFLRKEKKKPISEFIIQRILKQIIEGLIYMKKNKIIKRDLKLENILINFDDYQNYFSENNKSPTELYSFYDLEKDNFSIKISDLGYTTVLDGNNSDYLICGQPSYLAPEIKDLLKVLGKDNKYNSSIDLWSLGAVLYEMLIGLSPLIGNSAEEIIQKSTNNLHQIPPYISISIESIYLLNGLLQFYPNKRLNWDEVLYHPFLTKDVRNFKIIKLNFDEEKSSNFCNEKKIKSYKDYSNYLWILFKESGIFLPFSLDNLDKSTYEDIIKDLIAEEIYKTNENQINEENLINKFFDKKNKNILSNKEINKYDKEINLNFPDSCNLINNKYIDDKIIKINGNSINKKNEEEKISNLQETKTKTDIIIEKMERELLEMEKNFEGNFIKNSENIIDKNNLKSEENLKNENIPEKNNNNLNEKIEIKSDEFTLVNAVDSEIQENMKESSDKQKEIIQIDNYINKEEGIFKLKFF